MNEWRNKDMENLNNVHDALVAAAFESAIENSSPTKHVPTSVRLGEAGVVAAEICETNGTTLAKFLRYCCQQLAIDYGYKF